MTSKKIQKDMEMMKTVILKNINERFPKEEMKERDLIEKIESKYRLLEWMKIMFWIQLFQLVGIVYIFWRFK
jgi:hypothetical protein